MCGTYKSVVLAVRRDFSILQEQIVVLGHEHQCDTVGYTLLLEARQASCASAITR